MNDEAIEMWCRTYFLPTGLCSEPEMEGLCARCGCEPATGRDGILLMLQTMLGKASDGPWSPEWDSCDCGGGYGCSHDEWVTGVVGPTYTPNPSAKHVNPAEFSDMTTADASLMAVSRMAIEWLLNELEAAEMAALERGVEQERARVVAYLRELDAPLAHDIEVGAHDE